MVFTQNGFIPRVQCRKNGWGTVCYGHQGMRGVRICDPSSNSFKYCLESYSPCTQGVSWWNRNKTLPDIFTTGILFSCCMKKPSKVIWTDYIWKVLRAQSIKHKTDHDNHSFTTNAELHVNYIIILLVVKRLALVSYQQEPWVPGLLHNWPCYVCLSNL